MDKFPLKSKKFLAYMIAEFGWKISIFFVLWQYKDKIDFYALSILMCLVIINAFMQCGYILGQAALDRYVQVAEALLDTDDGKDKRKEDSDAL